MDKVKVTSEGHISVEIIKVYMQIKYDLEQKFWWKSSSSINTPSIMSVLTTNTENKLKYKD